MFTCLQNNDTTVSNVLIEMVTIKNSCLLFENTVLFLTSDSCFFFYRFVSQACSAIFLAARGFNIVLPMKPRPWWEVFLGNEKIKGNELIDVANAIFGTCNLHLGMEKDCKVANEPKSDVYVDWLVATKGFVRSINKEDSIEKIFNSPDSFLYFYHKELFEKDIPNESSYI